MSEEAVKTAAQYFIYCQIGSAIGGILILVSFWLFVPSFRRFVKELTK